MDGWDAEYQVLSTEAGRALLEEVSTCLEPGPAELERWRKRSPKEVVSAAVRLAVCRKRARVKFSRAELMWLEPTGLEQSTAEAVARHKAERFAGVPRAVDLCCGIGSDSVAMASKTGVIGVDLDGGMVRRARWNVEVYGEGDRWVGVEGRAERFGVPQGAFVHVDPDRRAGSGRRARSVEGYAPGVEFLRGLGDRVEGGAIKLSPASDFEAWFGGEEFEVELISLDGEAREATVWFGAMRSAGRRATSLPSGASVSDREVARDARVEVINEVGEWVYDPDPALSRSGLLGGVAESLGLWGLASGVTLMTGSGAVESAFLTRYRVREVSAADEKTMRRYVAREGIGRLEIKPRGVAVTPETLRRRLRPEGPNAGTLMVVGSRGGGTRAIWAERG